MIFLNSPMDMRWLNDVHNVPREMKCAILYGDETSPKKIEAWRSRNPDYRQKPDFVYLQEKERALFLVEG